MVSQRGGLTVAPVRATRMDWPTLLSSRPSFASQASAAAPRGAASKGADYGTQPADLGAPCDNAAQERS